MGARYLGALNKDAMGAGGMVHSYIQQLELKPYPSGVQVCLCTSGGLVGLLTTKIWGPF